MLRRNHKRRQFLKATGAATIGALAGCAANGSGDGNGSSGDGSTDEKNTQSTSDPIIIGALEPLSGPFSPWGKPHMAGVEFAVKEINTNGGVLGRNLKLITADSESQASAANTAFQRMVEQQEAVAITGPASSDVGIRTSRTAEDLGVPLYLHMSGDEKVITSDTKHTFRVSLLPAPTTMKAQAELVADAGYEKVGAIVADYAWGHATKQAIEKEFGVDVTSQVAPVGASDFKPYIRKMPQDLQMLVATGHPPGAFSIAKQLYQLNYSPEVITGSGAPPNLVRSVLGKDANRGYTEIHMTDFNKKEFIDVAKRFAEQKGKQFGPHNSYGYVAGKLIGQSIKIAGKAEPKAIADATRNIRFDTLYPQPIEFSKYGELENQVQLYSQLKLEGPEYFPNGDYQYEEIFRTEPLPASPPEE